ncbi:MAG TPA: RidA family protein [Nitriliruptorales bacterium]|nr:RidA family protein [Nitriliruptorales bacterium]
MTRPAGHRFLDPQGLLPPRGFSHVALPASGQLVFVAGQTAHGRDGRVQGATMAEQFTAAARNLRTALAAAGARTDHLVALQIFVTDVGEYRASLGTIGGAWRELLGDRYPTVSLFEVSGLFDPHAKVELLATAVIPHGG